MTERAPETVTVFGEVLVDEFPEERVLGGAPFNVAYHLRRFGLAPVLITRVGRDEDGDRLLAAMADADLDARGVQRDAEHPTGRVRVALGDGAHTFEILPDQAYDFVDAEAAVAVARGLLPTLTYFGTLAQRGAVSRGALEALLAEGAGGLRWLDVNLREPWYDAETVDRSLSAADVVKLNDVEIEKVSSLLGVPGGDPAERAANLASRYGLRTVVVTCGERGAWAVEADGARAEVAGRPLDGPLADTVGAGDGFAAVYVLGLLRGWPAADTLARADAFARRLCLVRGAIPPDVTSYAPFLE